MLDPKHPITIGGKEYVITPPTLMTEDAFQDYLKKYAVSEVVRMRDTYGQAFPEALKAITQEIASGTYDWLSNEFLKAILCDKHAQKLAELVLNQEGSITLDTVKKHWRDVDGDTLIKDGEVVPVTKGVILFSKIWEYINRPNSPGPAQ